MSILCINLDLHLVYSFVLAYLGAYPLVGIALPLAMLRDLRVRPTQKWALVAVFVLALIDVVFDVLRTVYAVQGTAVALHTLWDILEPTIGVMVCALPAYRALLSWERTSGSRDQQRRSAKSSSWPPSYRQWFSSGKAGSKKSSGNDPSFSTLEAGCTQCQRSEVVALSKDPTTIIRSSDVSIISEALEDGRAPRVRTLIPGHRL